MTKCPTTFQSGTLRKTTCPPVQKGIFGMVLQLVWMLYGHQPNAGHRVKLGVDYVFAISYMYICTWFSFGEGVCYFWPLYSQRHSLQTILTSRSWMGARGNLPMLGWYKLWYHPWYWVPYWGPNICGTQVKVIWQQKIK